MKEEILSNIQKLKELVEQNVPDEITQLDQTCQVIIKHLKDKHFDQAIAVILKEKEKDTNLTKEEEFKIDCMELWGELKISQKKKAKRLMKDINKH